MMMVLFTPVGGQFERWRSEEPGSGSVTGGSDGVWSPSVFGMSGIFLTTSRVAVSPVVSQ